MQVVKLMISATHFVLETEHRYLDFVRKKKKSRYNRWNEKQVSFEICLQLGYSKSMLLSVAHRARLCLLTRPPKRFVCRFDRHGPRGIQVNTAEKSRLAPGQA